MKRKYSALFTVTTVLFTAFFTGCGADKEVTDDTESIAETSETIVSSEIVATQPPVNIIETEQVSDEDSENLSEAESNSKLRNAVDAVTSSVEWAKLDEITDNEIAQEFFKLDLQNPDYKDILIMQCPMSSVTAEIILIEANDGQAENALNALNERRTKLIDVDAFYPDAKAIAENSITGIYNNVAYFIAGTNAEESEKILLQELENSGY
jgi:hypothetical protein